MKMIKHVLVVVVVFMATAGLNAAVIPDTVITATSVNDNYGADAVDTINGDGMTGDLHNDVYDDCWLGYNAAGSGVTSPAGVSGAGWIAYEFSPALAVLDDMWVWNYNQTTPNEDAGIRNCSIHYYDGSWQLLGDYELTKGPGATDYAHDDTIAFSAVTDVSKVCISVHDLTADAASGGWRNPFDGYMGLAEVRFYGTEGVAVPKIPVASITTTATNEYYGGDAVDATNEDGLAGDLHNDLYTDCWLGLDLGPYTSPSGNTGLSGWIMSEFDAKYDLGDMWVWNYNQTGTPGPGVRNCTIDYYDGASWVNVGDYELTQATGAVDLVHGDAIDLSGIAAEKICISVHAITTDANSGVWDGTQDYMGLAEVRFYGTPPENIAPTVDAFPALTIIEEGGMVELDAIVTDDGNPDPPATVTLTWSKDSGPGTVTFSPSDDVLDPNATFSAVGEYVLKLEGDDGGLTDSDTVTVRVVAADYADPALLHRWSFNSDYTDSVGTADASADGSNATITGNALDLTSNGPDTLVTVVEPAGANRPIESTLQGLGSSITIEMWYKRASDNGNDMRLFQAGTAWDNSMKLIYLGAGAQDTKFTLWSQSYSVNVAGAPMPTLGAYTHLVATLDAPGSIAALYVDGCLASSSNVVGIAPADLQGYGSGNFNIFLGRYCEVPDPHGTHLVNGFYDEVRVYSGVLSPLQVLSNYNDGPNVLDIATPSGPLDCGQVKDCLGIATNVMDFDEDCDVDFVDFADFAAEWLRCIDPTISGCEEPWL